LEFCRERALRSFVLSTVHRDYYATQSSNYGFHKFIERAYLEIRNKREQIHLVLQENKLQPQETLFIGDMQHDIETARYGGVLSCGVLTGYNTLPQLRAAEPDLIVEHLGELKGILERDGMDLLKTQVKAVSNRPCASTSATAVQKRMPVATVGALIYNPKGEVLMVRTPKWSHRWGIPGGKIKFGETAVDALQREIKEETNLRIEDIQFVLVQDCIHSKEFYRDEHFLLLNYTCVTRDSEVILNEEAVEFRWVTPQQTLKMDLNQPTRVLLEAVRGGK
jgi:ADP-ribose pyrophosphatase YjhB (NUDIX family)